MPSPWWSSTSIAIVFVSRTNHAGEPWLGRSVTSGSASQTVRTRASSRSWADAMRRPYRRPMPGRPGSPPRLPAARSPEEEGPVTTLPGPRGVQALRAAKRIVDAPVEAIESLAAEHGRTFGVHVGPTTIAIVGDRELVKVVLTGPQERYRWGPVFKIPLGVFVGPTSMLVSDGDDHARRRALVQPAFALRRLQTWRTIIVAELDRMIDALPIGESFDLAPRIQATVRRIVVRVLFGEELAEGADDIGERLAPASAYLNRPMLRQLPHPLPVGARERARASRRAF